MHMEFGIRGGSAGRHKSSILSPGEVETGIKYLEDDNTVWPGCLQRCLHQFSHGDSFLPHAPPSRHDGPQDFGPSPLKSIRSPGGVTCTTNNDLGRTSSSNSINLSVEARAGVEPESELGVKITDEGVEDSSLHLLRDGLRTGGEEVATTFPLLLGVEASQRDREKHSISVR